MQDREAMGRAMQRLFSPERGLWVVPVRHHSPACAWALSALIAEVRPTHVLIEGPEDFDRHIGNILDPGTRPPVAIIALTAVEGAATLRTASHYPLTAHSPEYVALQAGRAAGASLRFIDLPSGAFPDSPTPAVAQSLQDDLPFTSGDYINALCRATGCRDGHDLWDHLFETRLGTGDWRSFFRDVGAYCLGLRTASPPDALTLRREARMAGHVRAALGEGPSPRVVVVVGGYHAPVLCDPETPLDADAAAPAAASYLVRYGFAALDALGGYGAGLPLPGYYDRLWFEAQATGAAPANAWLMVLIIVMWTPPHFWALSLYTSEDYGKAGVPMMPVARGAKSTRLQIMIYSLLFVPCAIAPAFTGLGGVAYAAVSGLGGAVFL
ncbi:MAG TPA: DUF5682 family protein, partial [Tabrizicola sp.]|nr:DUF5682 family protein [Tabrizicola sp.]